MDKTNLITIIGSKQTDCGKMIRESSRLSEWNLCTQNLLYSNKLELESKLFNNIIIVVFSKDDVIGDKTIKDMLNTLSVIGYPVYVLLEDGLESADNVKIFFAENGLVPSQWGGDIDFLGNYDTDELDYTLEDCLFMHFHFNL